jgi:hypothetical protein
MCSHGREKKENCLGKSEDWSIELFAQEVSQEVTVPFSTKNLCWVSLHGNFLPVKFLYIQLINQS